MKYISGIIFSISAASVLASAAVIFLLVLSVLNHNRAINITGEESAISDFPAGKDYPAEKDHASGSPGRDSPEKAGAGNIIVTSPRDGEEIGLPAEIRGEARVFENQLNYRIMDANGKILAENYALADSPDIGRYGPFIILANYAEPETESGSIEVFNYSAKDGSEENKVAVSVVFGDALDMRVRVYFHNSKLDPEAADCGKVFPVERRIAKTIAPGKAALEELLFGPNALEVREGYSTSINPGAAIQKLTIEKGIARVDFNPLLEQSAAGSCRTSAIRAEITETLKQFSSVNEVVISIDGRTDDILQP